MLFSSRLKLWEESIKRLSCMLVMLFCFCLGNFYFIHAAESSEETAEWNIITKDKPLYKKIQKDIIDIKKRTGKNMPDLNVQDLVCQFNTAVNQDINRVMVSLSEIMEEKDLKTADRMLKIIAKRIFKNHIPSILLSVFNNGDIDINELSKKIVSESVRSLILRR